MIRKLFLMSFCMLSFVSSLRANTINALSCSRTDVQAAVAGANNNDTVVVPAGSCSWNASVSITHGITLQGAGQGVTNIILSNSIWVTVQPTGGIMRITGFTITGTNAANSAAIKFDGSYTSLRMDHMTFTNLPFRAVIVGYDTWYTSLPAIYGLFDHITYINNTCVPFGLHFGDDRSWLSPDDYGSVNSMYVEDSSFTFNVSNVQPDCDVWDTEHGARAVVRHNTITNGVLLGHDTGSTGASRGTRKYEYYANTWLCSLSDCGNSATGLRGGTGIFFDNRIPIYPNGWENATATEIYRITGVGLPWDFLCQANVLQLKVCSDLRPHCSGGDHRMCGVFESVGQTCTGGGVGICQNNPILDSDCGAGNTALAFIDGTGPGLSQAGYPCRDQVGRGQDIGPNHVQLLAPIYWWNNIDSNSNNQITTINVSSPPAEDNRPYIQANREYYTYTASFNGTTGMGRGLLSARPATCTPLTAYFATDTNTVYQCAATNTWSNFYKALTYPHPLQSGTSATSPPTNLHVTSVQ
jgi:hypothetical protein